MKFRVWCLSWEDDEEDGCDVERGKIGEGIETRRTIVSWLVDDAASAAEVYADYCHDNRDGYECTWPLKFRVRNEDGTVQDFDVERDFVTEFSACEVSS